MKLLKSNVVKEIHPENIVLNLVSFEVLKLFRFIDSNFEQFSNIYLISVTNEVSKLVKSNDFNDAQVEKKLYISLTDEVLNRSIFNDERSRHSLNI